MQFPTTTLCGRYQNDLCQHHNFMVLLSTKFFEAPISVRNVSGDFPWTLILVAQETNKFMRQISTAESNFIVPQLLKVTTAKTICVCFDVWTCVLHCPVGVVFLQSKGGYSRNHIVKSERRWLTYSGSQNIDFNFI